MYETWYPQPQLNLPYQMNVLNQCRFKNCDFFVSLFTEIGFFCQPYAWHLRKFFDSIYTMPFSLKNSTSIFVFTKEIQRLHEVILSMEVNYARGHAVLQALKGQHDAL